MAAADSVTGARPRASLEPYLRRQLSRPGQPCAVFLFDVDFFKTVNDVYGHLRGDRVLRQLADRVRTICRTQDALFRYGGDEFVVVLPDTDRSDAVRLALRLTERIRATEFAGDPPLHLTVSLGVASAPHDGRTADQLLDHADRRNYLAKRRGRDSAVADDVEISDGDGSRLWERDEPLRRTHEFLTRLQLAGRGAAWVHGPRGVGHTRFLAEVARLATLRGFAVVRVPSEPEPLPMPVFAERLLLIADLAAADRVPELLRAWSRPRMLPPVLGLVRAGTETGLAAVSPTATQVGEPVSVAGPDPLSGSGFAQVHLPELDRIELSPWSPATLRIWLRTVLRGEPSRALVSWFARQSAGLPALAARELDRVRGRRGLVGSGTGGWTVSPELLGRGQPRVRLPAPMTPLVGRDREVTRVGEVLAVGRLVTLVGAGGIGKTRLSLSVAAQVATRFDDGVCFVALAAARTADDVLAAVAAALDVSPRLDQSILDALAEQLADVELLLVLDNLEQALVAGPPLGQLLAAAGRIRALATSREPLGIYGEQVFRVPPLPLPPVTDLPQGAGAAAEAIATHPAIALFDQLARAADADFVLTAESLPAVAQLCRRLDGLPLAIELAAARTDQLSPTALLERLGPRLDALGCGPVDRPPRQQTLRGTVDWSYGLLDPQQQEIFLAVAVFPASATAAAIAAVAGVPADPVDAVADGLAALVRKSLLVAVAGSGGTRRYAMLNTIAARARQLPTEQRRARQLRDYLTYFAEFADRAGAGMAGPEQGRWAEELDHDYLNLRAALDAAVAADDLAVATRLCLGLWRYWRNGSHIRDGRQWLDRVISAPAGLADEHRRQLLYPAAVLAATQDDTATAARLGADCLVLTERVGDQEGTAQARNVLGVAAMLAGRYDEAGDHFRYGLEVWRELGAKSGMAIALGNLAKVCLRLGDIADADWHINQCLALEREAGNSRGVLLGLTCLAEILLARPDPVGAAEVARDALELASELGDLFGAAVALHQLGQCRLAVDDRPAALRLFVAALQRRYELGDRADLATSLETVAEVIVDDDPALAVRILAAVDSLRRRYGLVAPVAVQARCDATRAAGRAALGESGYAQAWGCGTATALDLIVDQALDCAPEGPRDPATMLGSRG
ncbi:diguanylate cyclase [Micromonospora sp. NBC_01813]|uniref:diguanylate cyclase n=1 Tax=Micromonospora sp. NBC_01813 TaxID=2975988 RepID=UPI002DDC02C4|nr:diguanylate cyclase [Micromonospora sp. NBC_01813]WSA11861.1 diguanylate cyclase [Micromonospora sp. NBC_01813]